MSTQQPQSLQQFIDNQKTQYATHKGIQAVAEYEKIVQPFINEITLLQKENKILLQQIPKKQRAKIVKKGKK